MGECSHSVAIYNTLADRISTWAYSPGYRFTEEELCSEFGVSRSPVREALNSLVVARLIEKEPHKGYKVRMIDLREINELYDTRLVLELEVVNLICKQELDTDVIKNLRTRWQAIAKNLSVSGGVFASEDEQFHEELAQAAGNQVLAQFLGDISKRIHFVRLSDVTNPERLERMKDDHLNLLDALEKRDCETAQEIMRLNILWGKEKVDSAIMEALFHAHHMA